MNRVSVEHIIDDTSKEIYEFEKHGNYWVYVAMYQAHRNDKDDVWGDEWNTAYEFDERDELDEVSRRLGYDDYDNLLEEHNYSDYLPEELKEVIDKFNPVIQKTIHGKPYYGGCSWGYGSRKEKYSPKMSEKDIVAEITRQVSKVKIKL